jgi:hypothetical protein
LPGVGPSVLAAGTRHQPRVAHGQAPAVLVGARVADPIAAMGILASVMPVVRGVRAPLAAGLLLLLSAWVTFQSGVPERPRGGVWGGLSRLDHVVIGIGLYAHTQRDAKLADLQLQRA